jgi:hypothetical protein
MTTISPYAQFATRPDMSFTEENMKLWMNEELSWELQPYLHVHPTFGPMLQHPLVYDIMMNMPGLNNRRLEVKKAGLAAALEKEDWSNVIGLHERPWRFYALDKYVLEHDDEDIALPLWQQKRSVQKLAEWLWTDSENIGQHQEEWLNLYRERPEGAVLGKKRDLKLFAELPDEVELFRGGGDDSFLSWSTKREVAERFTKRSGNEVRTQTVAKRDIFAYYTGRGEFEALTFVGMGE